MANSTGPDELLAQIRRLPLEDREYLESELVRDAYETGRRTDPTPLVAELVARAERAMDSPDDALTSTQSVAAARAALDVARSQKP